MGKTALLTKFLHDGFKEGCMVYSNYGLEFKHEKINLKWMQENPDHLVNAKIGIDEVQTYFDCRCSSSTKNRLFSYIILQSRKRKIDIIMSSQQRENVEIRIRRNLDYLYECTAYTFKNGVLKKSTLEDIEGKRVDRIYVFEHNFTNDTKRKLIFNPKKYFDLYNTDEFVDIVE